MKNIFIGVAVTGLLMMGCPTATDSTDSDVEASSRQTANEVSRIRAEGPIFDFQKEIWELMFVNEYVAGESQWVADDLPTAVGTLSGVNDQGEPFETEITRVGDEYSAENLFGFTDEQYLALLESGMKMVFVDGLFQLSDGTSQSYHGLGFSVIDIDSGNRVSAIFPFFEPPTNELEYDIPGPPEVGGSGSGFFSNHANYDKWWECPEVSDEICQPNQYLDQNCVDLACDAYKDHVNGAWDVRKAAFVTADNNLKTDRATCEDALAWQIALASATVSAGIWTALVSGGTSLIIAPGTAALIMGAAYSSHGNCIRAAETLANERKDRANTAFANSVDMARLGFDNAAGDCCKGMGDGCQLHNGRVEGQPPPNPPPFCGGDCGANGHCIMVTNEPIPCQCWWPYDAGIAPEEH